MRVLLSTIGSRGDVEPILALAIQLKALDQQVRVCAPPDFQEWIEAFAISAIPIGPMLRPLTATSAPILSSRPSPEVMHLGQRQRRYPVRDHYRSGARLRCVARRRRASGRSALRHRNA